MSLRAGRILLLLLLLLVLGESSTREACSFGESSTREVCFLVKVAKEKYTPSLNSLPF